MTGTSTNVIDSKVERVEDLLESIKSLRNKFENEKMPLSHIVTSLLLKAIEEIEKEANLVKDEYSSDMTTWEKIFTELQERFEDVASKLRMLECPPLGKVTFVRFIRNDKIDEKEIPLIEIRNSRGEYGLVYYLVENSDHNELKYGQHLIVQGGGINHVLEKVDEFSIDGVEATVTEILGEDRGGIRILVSNREHDESIIARPIEGMEIDDLVEGARVLVDRTAGLILEILPEHESSEFLVAEIPDVSFKDIGGLDSLIQEIEEDIVWPIIYPEVDEALSLPPPRGFALAGPPGVGKTMLAKAIVNRLNELLIEQHGQNEEDGKSGAYFFQIKGPALLNKWVGETERAMRTIFAQAKKKATPTRPVGIFFDEAESMFPIRGSGISSDIEKTNVTQFTSLMDGMEKRGNIIVILATNRIDLIDGAVIRPGRCDKILTVPRPDKKAAIAIFKRYLNPSWKEIHPVYNVDVHKPLDKDGKHEKVSKNRRVVKYPFRNDPQKAVDYLVERAVARMYDPSPSNEFLKIKFEGKDKQVVLRYGDLASGAMIENIVERAKKHARRRYLSDRENEALGVRRRDLYKAIEEAFAEIRIPGSSRGLRNWLAIEGISEGLDVVEHVFPPPNTDIPEED